MAEKDGYTALILAARKGSTTVAVALLDHHDASTATIDLNLATKKGNTALMLAVFNGHVDTVGILLGATGKGGATADLTMMNGEGMNVFILAANKGRTEITTALLGANGKRDAACAAAPIVSEKGTQPKAEQLCNTDRHDLHSHARLPVVQG